MLSIRTHSIFKHCLLITFLPVVYFLIMMLFPVNTYEIFILKRRKKIRLQERCLLGVAEILRRIISENKMWKKIEKHLKPKLVKSIRFFFYPRKHERIFLVMSEVIVSVLNCLFTFIWEYIVNFNIFRITENDKVSIL